MHAAVSVAAIAGASLDVLILGAAGEDLDSDDERGSLVVNREREMYEKAVERATEAELDVTWITVEEAVYPWAIVRDQLKSGDYDLVIDDLGDVSLGSRLRLTQNLEVALGPGQVGEIPMRLLTDTDLPLLLVIDEIRLGLAPIGLLKAGTVAALALGAVALPVAASVSPTVAASVGKTSQDGLEELVANLEGALDPELDAEARAEQASAASRSGSTADRQAAAEAAAVTTKAPTAPKGGASATDVSKAQKKAATSKKAHDKAKSTRAKQKKSLATAEEELTAAQDRAAASLEELAAAEEAASTATQAATSARSAASGIVALLPGGISTQEAEQVDAAAQVASIRLDEAMAEGEAAYDALTAAEEQVATSTEKLASAQAAVAEAKAQSAYDAKKVAVYKESLAKSRTSPVMKGNYRLTARFGQSGPYWSSGYHTGLDFAGPVGTNIHAAASGKVVEAGYAGAYGNRVVIQHASGYQTSYNHLSNIGVRVGQSVQTGDQIGDLGNTGNSTGPHLHFEVTKGGKFIDPETWLGW